MLFSHGFSHAFFTAYNSGDGTLINLYLTDCAKQKKHCHFNQAFGNLPKSLLYFSQDRIKKPSYF